MFHSTPYQTIRNDKVAYLKLALAEIVTADNVIVFGCISQLLPHTISHLLRVTLIGDRSYRLAVAAKTKRLSEKEG